MKTSITVVLVTLCISFFSITSHANSNINDALTEGITAVYSQEAAVKGTYLGRDEAGYNFSVVDSSGNENIVTFQKIEEALAVANDLNSKSSIGKTFEITFEVAKEEALDANGEAITQETRTIKALKVSK